MTADECHVYGLDIETSVKTGEPACLTFSRLVWDASAEPRGASCEGGGRGAAAGAAAGPGAWVPSEPWGLHARDPRARAEFVRLLSDERVVLVGQNVAFDLVRLGTWWGLLPPVRAAYEAGRVRDTMLRQSLIDVAWPAKVHGVWNEELERWFPAKFAWHAGLRRRVRIDEGDDDGGGGRGQKGGLDALAWRLLAVDLSALKKNDDAVRLRYHEVIDLPWDEWPADFRDYALGDPKWTLEIYLEQAELVRSRTIPRCAVDDALPPMFADGWDPHEPDAPLVDEQFQVMAAVPFQMMSQRGVRVDVALVRRQRDELSRLAEWAAELCVRHGTMREEYDFAELTDDESGGGKLKPLRKGEVATPERLYRTARSRWRSLRENDPAGFEAFLALARRLGKLRGVERKGQDAEVRRRVEEIAARRGTTLGKTAKGKTKADADAVYDAALPAAETQASDPAAADLADVLGPKLLRIARRALAGSDGEAAAREGRTDDAERLSLEADGWSLARLAAAIEAAEDPGLAAKAVHSKAVKFDTSFLRGLDVPEAEVHAWFRTMKDTGRTSMVGAIRQNMPKNGGVRECIVPRLGYVFVQCDYSQVEMLGLAYVLDSIFGAESSLTRAIRDGVDCHLQLACHPLLGLGLTYDDAKAIRARGAELLAAAGEDRSEAECAHPEFPWSKYDQIEKTRFSAKAANFGFPGGMMPRKFAATQKKQNNLVLSIEDATLLRQAWLDTWPEVARYFEWAKAKTEGGRTAKVRHLDGSGEAGHWRGGCAYTQLCNTLFQGLVARGAKWTAWRLFVACYLTPNGPLDGCHPVLFVHDEFVLEAPVDRAEVAKAELIRIMVEGMVSVMPGQRVKAEAKILPERWTK